MATTTKKTTKREHFTNLLAIPAVAENAELVAFINHELELLAKKNISSSGEKKLTPTQLANEAIKAEIYELMQVNRLYTIAEMVKEFEVCANFSSSKMSSLLKQMYSGENPIVERVEEKRKVYFRAIK